MNLRSSALLPQTVPGSSEGDIALKTVSKVKQKLHPPLEIFFRLSNSNTTHVPHLFLIRKWRIRLLGAVGWHWHSLPSSKYGNICAVKRYQYQNVQHFPTILKSLHVLDLFFPYQPSILKLPFFMKHPVHRVKNNTTNREYLARAICWSFPRSSKGASFEMARGSHRPPLAKMAKHAARARVNTNNNISHHFTPDPIRVCRVTHSVWGGGAHRPPVVSQTTGPILKIQTPFDSPVPDLSKQCATFYLPMLSANKANEPAWIVSLTFVNIISRVLWP